MCISKSHSLKLKFFLKSRPLHSAFLCFNVNEVQPPARTSEGPENCIISVSTLNFE